MSAPKSFKVGAISYRSRSAAALSMLKRVADGLAKGQNPAKLKSKVQIAEVVGMTPQTVHAVQVANKLKIDFRAIQKAHTELNRKQKAKTSEKKTKNVPSTEKAAA